VSKRFFQALSVCLETPKREAEPPGSPVRWNDYMIFEAQVMPLRASDRQRLARVGVGSDTSLPL